MAIDPINTRTIAIDELSDAAFNLTDNIVHGVGPDLKRGTIEDFATFLSTYLGAIGGVGFKAVSVPDGGTLPATTQEEFILVGPGTFTNVGGGADITTTEELNALVSNGTYWFIGVEIPINVELAGITQFIRAGFTNTTPSEDAVFNAIASLSNSDQPMADTGVLTFAGLFTNSSTTINIGAAEGYVVDNETDPYNPVKTFVSYLGEANKTVTTLGSGSQSFVMLDSAGISFQNTFPTSAERKAKIWLGKVSHPTGSVTLVVNEPDYILSPLAFSRDWFQDLGPYVNNNVYPYANGANLSINITGGTITGDGINFVNSKTDPNHISVSASSAQSFMIRTQTGAGGAGTTLITPTVYDVAGTITAIPGSSNQATIQYVWCVPGQGFIVQLGQTLYTTFSSAVSALGKETAFTIYPNLKGNAIPIAALVVTKGCTALNDTGVTAQFFRANKNGDFFGASAGTSTSTLQSAYTNSVQPTITTNSSLGAFTVQRGSSADTDFVIVGKNGAGTTTFSAKGDGGLDSSGTIRATGQINPVGGVGTEIRWDATANGGVGVGSILAFDRNGPAVYKPLEMKGLDLRFNISNVEAGRFAPTTRNLLINTSAVDNGIDKVQVNGTVSGSAATLSNQFVTKAQLDEVRPFKVYVALISQTGTSAPTIDAVLENTLGGVPSFTYTSPGVYGVFLSSGFPTQAKTSMLITSSDPSTLCSMTWLSASQISLRTNETTTAAGTNGKLSFATITIRVYP